MTLRFRRSAAALATLALLAVGGCSSGDSNSESNSQSDAAPTEAVEASDAWVKAATAADQMTAVFVTLQNLTAEDVQITSATTDMSDETELHEMIEQDGEMIMQETQDGLSISPNGTLQLEPGGYHIMVMNLQEDVVAGEKHQITLTLDNGDVIEFEAVAKDFAGANESYHGEPSAGAGNGDHDTHAPDMSSPAHEGDMSSPAGEDAAEPTSSAHGG
ncbi:copper chaperone PCu(A)C [Blastococcus sp. Marseille-P5729]|uniref:copper chaperone PCu(A)C n=1 Tax=Blastococcus sp. Marseille-P5729 TaxID=2086582 RepID=UPI000D0FF26C|nr:copper chaperone PCu(A)C [Blastococcus sp. Marseille-P5729]